MTRRALVALACALLSAGPARGDTNIYGIPEECYLQVVECSPDRADAGGPQRVLSSVFMRSSWTIRGYVPSPDGKTLLVPLQDGIRVIRDGRTDDYPLELCFGLPDYQWHPDSKRVAFWVKATPPVVPGERVYARKALAVLDVTRLPPAPLPADAKVPYEVVYWSSNQSPFGFAWSAGQALLVLSTEVDRDTNLVSGVVSRVLLPSAGQAATPAHDLLRLPGKLEYAYGSSAGVAAVTSSRLLVGHPGGLLAVNEQTFQPIQDVPGAIYDLAWSSDRARDRLLLFYPKPVKATTGQLYQGVYLLDLDHAPEAPPRPPVQLYDLTDVHSVWFSPRGTYASWATPRVVCFLPRDAKPTDAVQVTIPTLPDGEDPLIKGFAWSADETKLAITAGNKLYVYELATKALHVAAEVGTMDDTFTAQPTWIGDRVIVGAYEDAVKSKRVRPRVGHLDLGGTPERPEDPAGGRGTKPQPPPRRN